MTKEQEKHVEVVCLVDKSASMGLIKKATINGFNKLLTEQQKNKEQTNMTLSFFSDQLDSVCWRKPIKDVKPLDDETYVPEGGTSIFDAICYSIDRLREELYGPKEDNDQAQKVDKDTTVLFTILTDGDDADSIMSAKDVFERVVETRGNHGWEFQLLTSERKILERYDLGIPAASTIIFAATNNGALDAFETMTMFIKTRS